MPSLGRINKPKTRSGKRFLENREPKIEENAKNVIFIRGATSSGHVLSVAKDLHKLKKPSGKFFSRKNDFLPFENSAAVEQFAQKADASIFAFTSHNKKRPHNMVFGRMFDGQILDMVELGVDTYIPIEDFKVPKIALGTKPMLVFCGEEFDTEPSLKRIKSIFVDFFKGPNIEAVRLQGLEHVIQFSVVEKKIHFRSYRVLLKKSATKLPRIELDEIGPRIDFDLRREKLASDSLFKQACKQPYQLKPKPVKNIKRTTLGSKMGRLHMQRQDYGKLQTRKFKGLKKGRSAKASRVPQAIDGDDISPKKRSRGGSSTGGAGKGGKKGSKRQKFDFE